MATFTGVEEITFDLTKYVDGMAGTVPEPSSAQIENFLAFIREVMPTKVDENGERTLDTSALEAFFKEKAEEGQPDPEDLVNDAIAAVCSDTPSAAQLKALPYRVKQGFYGFIMGSFFSPEA